ncbi:MAG: hypothetical protein EDX89_03300 [Acidobacteria bacterium]|nr:MAG: hypothetical protein EDX89_03300 [Acidobacteriota bacterium]MCE7958392.1 hypothetical protein [Acidobacteria bacterium ACB2]
MCRPVRGVLARAAASALVAATLAAGAARASDPEEPGYVAPKLGPSFRTTVERAARRLDGAPCSSVLTEFVDGRTGRPLVESLRETGMTAGAFLSSLYFLDGTGTPLCRQVGVLAHTLPGGRAVLVCREQFLTLERRDERSAARVLLHEALHALGLKENPPSPWEIDQKVVDRCGW